MPGVSNHYASDDTYNLSNLRHGRGNKDAVTSDVNCPSEDGSIHSLSALCIHAINSVSSVRNDSPSDCKTQNVVHRKTVNTESGHNPFNERPGKHALDACPHALVQNSYIPIGHKGHNADHVGGIPILGHNPRLHFIVCIPTRGAYPIPQLSKIQ